MALFDMKSNKAPKIDGSHVSFFQKGWGSLKLDHLRSVSTTVHD